MPIYEFFCSSCQQKVEVFTRSIAGTAAARCPRCGGAELRRLISRFAVHRASDVYGSLDEERYLDALDEGDPRAMAAFARRMAAESGEAGDPEMEQMLARMEAGEMPDDFGDGGEDDADDLGF